MNYITRVCRRKVAEVNLYVICKCSGPYIFEPPINSEMQYYTVFEYAQWYQWGMQSPVLSTGLLSTEFEFLSFQP